MKGKLKSHPELQLLQLLLAVLLLTLFHLFFPTILGALWSLRLIVPDDIFVALVPVVSYAPVIIYMLALSGVITLLIKIGYRGGKESESIL